MKRNGFSLIELLIVVAIIAVLVGIIMPAINAARQASRRAVAVSEMNQLNVAVAGAKETMGAKYIPNYSYIWSTYDTADAFQAAALADLRQFFGNRFGSVNPMNPNIVLSGLPNWGPITGSQCLVFYLGGYRDGNFTVGFGGDVVNPFVTTTMAPKVWFDFPTNRLWVPQNGGVPVFTDVWLTPTQFTPYHYLTSQRGGDYANNTRVLNKPGLSSIPAGNYVNYGTGHQMTLLVSLTVYPVVDFTGKFANQNGWQIISGGKDGIVGPGGNWRPGVSPYAITDPGYDDLVNFRGAPLGDAD